LAQALSFDLSWCYVVVKFWRSALVCRLAVSMPRSIFSFLPRLGRGRVTVEEEHSQERPALQQRLSTLRLRGAGPDQAILSCSAGFLLVVVLYRMLMLNTLEPNEYGLMRNKITGTIHEQVHRGGLFLTGPFYEMIKFPATQMTMHFQQDAFKNSIGEWRLPVATRTGADPEDVDGGGQPITISCSIQYTLVPETLREVYLHLGSFENAQQRFYLFAGNEVGNAAQDWTPQDFWQRRDRITQYILEQVNRTLWHDGHIVAVRLQITKIDFARQFEDSITQIQVAEQASVTNQYQQQETQVEQNIQVMKAVNEAHIANISAGAEADAKEICAYAKRDAFNQKQGMKATKYAELKRVLGFAGPQMTQYLKVKAVQSQLQAKPNDVVVAITVTLVHTDYMVDDFPYEVVVVETVTFEFASGKRQTFGETHLPAGDPESTEEARRYHQDTQDTWQLPEGEFLAKVVSENHADRQTRCQFVTSAGTTSPWYGIEEGGETATYEAAEGNSIVGLEMTQGQHSQTKTQLSDVTTGIEQESVDKTNKVVVKIAAIAKPKLHAPKLVRRLSATQT